MLMILIEWSLFTSVVNKNNFYVYHFDSIISKYKLILVINNNNIDYYRLLLLIINTWYSNINFITFIYQMLSYYYCKYKIR